MPIFTRIKKSIAASPPAKQIVGRSKVTSLPGFRGIPLFDVVKFFFAQVRTVGMTGKSIQHRISICNGNSSFHYFPFYIIPFFPISKQFERELYGLIRDVVPGEKDNSILIGFLKDFINKPRSGLLSLGFILSLFFSSNAIMGIMRSFDKNYLGFTKRTRLSKKNNCIEDHHDPFYHGDSFDFVVGGSGNRIEMDGDPKHPIKEYHL